LTGQSFLQQALAAETGWQQAALISKIGYVDLMGFIDLQPPRDTNERKVVLGSPALVVEHCVVIRTEAEQVWDVIIACMRPAKRPYMSPFWIKASLMLNSLPTDLAMMLINPLYHGSLPSVSNNTLDRALLSIWLLRGRAWVSYQLRYVFSLNRFQPKTNHLGTILSRIPPVIYHPKQAVISVSGLWSKVRS
jgi:hypothetical protein